MGSVGKQSRQVHKISAGLQKLKCLNAQYPFTAEPFFLFLKKIYSKPNFSKSLVIFEHFIDSFESDLALLPSWRDTLHVRALPWLLS